MAANALLGLTCSQLEAYLEQHGFKRFHARQIMRWLYREQVLDVAGMSNLSQALRQHLATAFVVELPPITLESLSADGVVKWLISIDGQHIEMVAIPERGRMTLCVSTQIGCAMNCPFCVTGAMGFNRNLTAAEIIAQVVIANRQLQQLQLQLVTNVVFMGMGEPLANYQNLGQCLDVLLDPHGFALSRRKVTVSTSGLVPQMKKLAVDYPVSLAVSLHAGNDSLRNVLVPINKKYPLEELLSACIEYCQASPRLFITFEYIVLAGVNDQKEHVEQLAQIARRVPSKINLIPYNNGAGNFSTPSEQHVKHMQRTLMQAGIVTTIRRERGGEIQAACGQLAGQFTNRRSPQKQTESAQVVKWH